MLNRFIKKQNKSKGSKARKLPNLDERNHLVNIKGFIGNVQSNIKIPETNVLEDNKSVPIYLISAHGEMCGGLRLSRQSIPSGIPIVEETRNGHIFNVTGKNQWLVHTAPVRNLICPSEFDETFFKFLTENPIETKRILFSKSPERLYTNVTKNTSEFKTPHFGLPGTPYPRKNNTFYDNPNNNKSYDWPMGVYPVFNSHESIIKLFHKKPKRYIKTGDIEGRIFNDNLLKKMNWKGMSKTMKKYIKLTQTIKDSLPKYNRHLKKWEGGKDITTEEIMDIMGEGIYISLTCSPFTNTYYDKIPIDNKICSYMGEKVIEEVSRVNKELWEEKYNNHRSKATIRKQKDKYKQETMMDWDAPLFGKKNTGVGISKNGRMTYLTKEIELDDSISSD